MIFYQMEDPDYGWLTHTLDSLMDEIKLDLASIDPGEVTYTIRLVEMDQAEFDALQTTDEIDE